MTTFSAAQRGRVTMLDVVEHARVSKASVSRFIGEDRALLSEANAKRIEQAISELGCALFEDIGLIALDDLDWYPLVGSGITALAQPMADIGASAFECLLKRLRGDDGPARTLDFAARLIERGSTRGSLV